MELLAGMRDEAVKAGSQFVAINCLQLPSPQHVFSRLWEKLSGQHLGPARWAGASTAMPVRQTLLIRYWQAHVSPQL